MKLLALDVFKVVPDPITAYEMCILSLHCETCNVATVYTLAYVSNIIAGKNYRYIIKERL